MTTNPTTEETRMDDTDAPTVCITHGRFIPCRRDGRHHYSDNPFWVKCVRDFQSSPIEGLTWEDATPVEAIADRAAIRDSDEPSERGDFPCCSGARAAGATVAGLDLNAIEARALAFPEYDREWHSDGPWWSDGAGESMVSGFDRCAVVVPAPSEHDRLEPVSCVMEHIAGMDPATTLALVDALARVSRENEALRAKVAAVEALAEHWQAHDSSDFRSGPIRAALATSPTATPSDDPCGNATDGLPIAQCRERAGGCGCFPASDGAETGEGL